METYRIRYLGGARRTPAIELVREIVGVGLRAAKELVDTRAVLLENVSAAEARHIARRFAEIAAEIAVERTSRDVYAYAPEHPDRGDQPIMRLRVDEAHGLTEQGLSVADSEIALLEAVSARERSMEAELRERPDNADAHVIYGDWLQARGDPRGQLVMLQHACEQVSEPTLLADLREREREFRRRHRGHLFGPLRDLAEMLVVRWSRGFIDAAFVGVGVGLGPEYGPMHVLHDLLRLPIAARMTSLGLTTMLLHQPQLEALLAKSEVVEHLRELELGDHVSLHASNRPLPSFADLWPKLRKLRKLTIHTDHPPLRTLHSDTLEHIELQILQRCAEFAEPFTPNRLPRLRTLTLEFPDAEQLDPAALADLLALPEFAGVRELIVRIPNHAIHEALADAFANTPRLAGLEMLDLSRCVADVRAMEAIVRARDRGQLPAEMLLPVASR